MQVPPHWLLVLMCVVNTWQKWLLFEQLSPFPRWWSPFSEGLDLGVIWSYEQGNERSQRPHVKHLWTRKFRGSGSPKPIVQLLWLCVKTFVPKSWVWKDPVGTRAFVEACHEMGTKFSKEQQRIQVGSRNQALEMSNGISPGINGNERKPAATFKPHLPSHRMGSQFPQRVTQVQHGARVPALTWSCSENTCILHACPARVVLMMVMLPKPAACSAPRHTVLLHL